MLAPLLFLISFSAFELPTQSPASSASYKFDFSGTIPAGYTEVQPTNTYSGDTGYGFEPGVSIQSHPGYVTADGPFFFSAAVPEGNYKVTVTLGDPQGTSLTTVKAELRRLTVQRCRTAKGVFATRTFIVNVRRPEINADNRVQFKDREKTFEAWAWDERLTLQFSDTSPKLSALTIEKVTVPTVYIAGDSTSTDQAKEPFNSWGQMITGFFEPTIAVANNGESGESARSFIGENRWAKLMSLMQAGDYLLIQFGHNDQKDTKDGAGPFTTFKANLERFVQEAKERGATPILITPMNRRTFDAAGKVTNSLGDFPAAVRQVADEKHVALIDLNAMSKMLYEALGLEESGKLFAGKDTTHHSDYGSYELAKCVASSMAKLHLPLPKYLRADFLTFDPSHPDLFATFDLPMDPDSTTMKPYGQ